MIASNVLKAFRTGVANRSEGDIIEHVLVLEMFQRFSNTQTYLNKQTMSWCKDFLWRHVFLIAFVKLTERCQQATPHLFCVKEWHVNKNHSDDMSRDISLKFVACVCGKSGWALGSIDLVAWTALCLLRTTSWTLTQVSLEVFEGLWPSARALVLCKMWHQTNGKTKQQTARALYAAVENQHFINMWSACAMFCLFEWRMLGFQ